MQRKNFALSIFTAAALATFGAVNANDLSHEPTPGADNTGVSTPPEPGIGASSPMGSLPSDSASSSSDLGTSSSLPPDSSDSMSSLPSDSSSSLPSDDSASSGSSSVDTSDSSIYARGDSSSTND